ncbi:MAG: GAF domain-containing protein [Promethearchaeota archaeon]|nr:MAG: GAF domain-containing protein [Candidatus Lokiarchaeota archaeon]
MSPKLGIQFRDKIIKAFTESEDDQVYPEVLDIILSAIDSKYGIFGYIDVNGDLVCPSMTKDVWDECQIPDKDIIFPREDWVNSNAIWARALIEGKTKYSNQPLNPPEGHIPMNRAIVVPIIYRKKIIGILEVANKISDYTKDDVNSLETFARYISPLLFSRLESMQQRKELNELRDRKLKKVKIVQLDDIDKEILNKLYSDGRQSNTQIGTNLKNTMSHTGVQNRIKKLIDSNILKIQGNINFNTLNTKVAYVNVKLQKFDDIDKFINKFKLCPRIFLISRITGQYYIKLGIIGRNMDDLNEFINHCLLADTQLISLSEVIFASDISKPEFLPLTFFEINNQNTPCGKSCLECDSYINKRCFGCDFL